MSSGLSAEGQVWREGPHGGLWGQSLFKPQPLQRERAVRPKPANAHQPWEEQARGDLQGRLPE